MSKQEQCSAFDTAPRKILRDIFLKYIKKSIIIESNVIDLGCGPADYIIELCKENPDIKITGVDGSAEMIAIAQQAVYSSNLIDQIFLKNSMFENINEKYDTVISTNTLHHSSDPNEFWKIIKKISNKNLFVLDLLRPDTEKEVEKIIELHAANTNLYYQKDFRNSLKAAFTLQEIKKQLIENNLGHLTVETLDNKIVIIYGSITV